MALVVANMALAGLIALVDQHGRVDFASIVRDPNAIAGQPAYFGAYSNLGVLIWCAGASIGLFAAAVAPPAPLASRVRPALLVGAAYMAFAGLDDLYMIHEGFEDLELPEAFEEIELLEAFEEMELSERSVLLVHLILLGAFVWKVRPIWRRTAWPLLGAALACFAGSIALDALELPRFYLFIEDVLKVTGISMLAAFVVSMARDVVIVRT